MRASCLLLFFACLSYSDTFKGFIYIQPLGYYVKRTNIMHILLSYILFAIRDSRVNKCTIIEPLQLQKENLSVSKTQNFKVLPSFWIFCPSNFNAEIAWHIAKYDMVINRFCNSTKSRKKFYHLRYRFYRFKVGTKTHKRGRGKEDILNYNTCIYFLLIEP